MKLLLYLDGNRRIHLGVAHEQEVYDLSASNGARFASLADVLGPSAPDPESLYAELSNVIEHSSPAHRFAELDHPQSAPGPCLCKPIDAQEVWGAGVTYLRSRKAREAESVAARAYASVYEAERPELFFKATPSRVAGPYEPIGVRGDSRWTVPEAELALVLNSRLQIVGYSLGNDLTARDIEGENPLYLPQAKIYDGCCAIGPAITLCQDIPSPREIEIEYSIARAGHTLFSDRVAVRDMKRSFDELVRFLGRHTTFPTGVVLLTGTGSVPPEHICLEEGDVVQLYARELGILSNPVIRLVPSQSARS